MLWVNRMDQADFISLIDNSDTEGVKAQIEENPSLVSMRDKAGRSPLHIAVQLGDYEMCLCLIRIGVDVNSKDDKGDTPLHIASTLWDDSPALMDILIWAGADPNKRNNEFMSPIMTAVQYSNLAGFSYLLGAGAKLGFKDRKRRGLAQIAQWVIDGIRGQRKFAVQRVRAGALLRMSLLLEQSLECSPKSVSSEGTMPS